MATKEFAERGRQRPTELLLRDVVISRIEPNSISEHPEFLYPGVYDMMYLDAFIPCFVLYRMDSTDPSAVSNFVRAVKHSLSQVLSLYYPMAGKWIVADDAWGRKLVCNDEGAVFVEAAVDYEMDDVLDRHDFNPPEELTGEHAVPGFEATSTYKTPEAKEFPSLIVQVTRFKCGGVALTLNFNHTTVDGFAFDRFVKSWSEILSMGGTSAKPVFDRSLVVSHIDKAHLLGIPADMENVDDVVSSYFRFPLPNLPHKNISKLFGVRKNTVERLRQRAKEEHFSDTLDPERPQRFTTFECVSAQLWRCCARIPKVLESVTSGGEDLVRIGIAVEGRRKWSNPPLPEDYVGNVCIATPPLMLPCSELTDKPFSFAASHIHQSIGTVNHRTSGELLDGIMKVIKEARSTQETEKPAERNRIFDLVVSGWSRFDNFYNLDFGYGGPFLFSPCLLWDSTSGVTVFFVPPPPNSDNAIGIYFRGPPQYVNILLDDPEFVHLVS